MFRFVLVPPFIVAYIVVYIRTVLGILRYRMHICNPYVSRWHIRNTMLYIANTCTYNRILIMASCVAMWVFFSTQYISELTLLISNPMKEISTDWRTESFYYVVNNAFGMDSADLSMRILGNDLAYFPSCEINLGTDTANRMFVRVLMYQISIISYPISIYQLILLSAPSIYGVERRIVITEYEWQCLCILLAIVATHNIWAHIYSNVSYHTYNEFNYYEFDVDLNVHIYVDRYVNALYIHTMLLHAGRYGYSVRGMYIYIGIALSRLTGLVMIYEVIYYVTLAFLSRAIGAVATVLGAHIYR